MTALAQFLLNSVIMMNFNTHVLKPIREAMSNRRLQIPKSIKIEVTKQNGVLQILGTLEAKALQENFQSPSAAAPSYLLCYLYWLETLTGQRATCEVKITGRPDDDGMKHWNRSRLILHEFQSLLGDRFRISSDHEWAWPQCPIINRSNKNRKQRSGRMPVTGCSLTEHDLEVHIANDPIVLRQFQNEVEQIENFERQWPVGLFEYRVAEKNRWAPGGNSQVDLWARSIDRKTIHLFELKKPGNKPLGILPEAFYYARLLYYAQTSLPGGSLIRGSGEDYAALRKARSITMWLIAPEFHPLIYHQGHSPLAWINKALASQKQHLRFAILPFKIPGGFNLLQGNPIKWQTNRRWPPLNIDPKMPQSGAADSTT